MSPLSLTHETRYESDPVVADHIAALEERLESSFDLTVIDEAPAEAPVEAPATRLVESVALAPAAVSSAEVTDVIGVESYAELAGADEDEIETTVDGLVPFALTPTAAMSPGAAAAKRHGRRRLVLLLAVVSGLIAFVGLAAAATAQASTSEAALSVVEASTTTTPVSSAALTTVAPTTPLTPDTTVPSTEAPSTIAPATTIPPITGTPSTKVATSVPTTVTTTARPTTTSAAPAQAANPVGNPASNSGFLDCVRARESRGDYGAMNPSGAHGAYQMMPTTARETALRAGRSDLASTPVLNWSKADQDAMAAHLYQWQGATPWGGGCSYPSN